MRSSVQKLTPRRHNRRKRIGVVTLEFIIVAPIVFIAVIAIFEFGFLALTLQVGQTALIEGTRRGAELYPSTYPLDSLGPDNDIADQIVEIMNAHLNVQHLEIYDPTQGFADNPEPGECANPHRTHKCPGGHARRGGELPAGLCLHADGTRARCERNPRDVVLSDCGCDQPHGLRESCSRLAEPLRHVPWQMRL